MLTTKKKISVIILSLFCILFLLSGIFLLLGRPFFKNPVKHTFKLNEQEVFVKDNSLIARGILRGVERNDEMVALKVEMWNYTNNKYTVEDISFPTKYLVNADKVYRYEFDNSYPIVDVKFNFNRFGKSDSKRIRNWFVDRKNPLTAIENIEIVDGVKELEKQLEQDDGYIYNNILDTVSQIYDLENPTDGTHSETLPKKISKEKLPILRKSLALQTRTFLPSDAYTDIFKNSDLSWGRSSTVEDFVNTKQLSIEEVTTSWNDEKLHLNFINRLKYMRGVSEYLWIATNYYLENSFDCSKQENMSVCKELVNLYTYNKATLADSSLRGGYGVCSATYMLPELVRLTKDEGLSRDLDLIIKNKEKLYSSCTFSGGGNGLCARDLKESVNCGLLLAESGDTEMIKNFVLDRYAFFDEIDYGEVHGKAPVLSAKDYCSVLVTGLKNNTVDYMVSHLDYAKFLFALERFK